jgi:hypothetical protein
MNKEDKENRVNTLTKSSFYNAFAHTPQWSSYKRYCMQRPAATQRAASTAAAARMPCNNKTLHNLHN